jgi:hypothetical protein
MVQFDALVLDSVVQYKRSNIVLAKKMKALIMTEQGGTRSP